MQWKKHPELSPVSENRSFSSASSTQMGCYRHIGKQNHRSFWCRIGMHTIANIYLMTDRFVDLFSHKKRCTVNDWFHCALRNEFNQLYLFILYHPFWLHDFLTWAVHLMYSLRPAKRKWKRNSVNSSVHFNMRARVILGERCCFGKHRHRKASN